MDLPDEYQPYSHLTFDDAIDAIMAEIKLLNNSKELNKEYYRGQFELLCYILPGDQMPDEVAPVVADKLGLPNIFDPDF